MFLKINIDGYFALKRESRAILGASGCVAPIVGDTHATPPKLYVQPQLEEAGASFRTFSPNSCPKPQV